MVSRFNLYAHFDKTKTIKRLEQFVLNIGGMVALYADTHLSKEDVMMSFDKSMHNYEELRKKYDCERAFLHVYDKVSLAGREDPNHTKKKN